MSQGLAAVAAQALQQLEPPRAGEPAAGLATLRRAAATRLRNEGLPSAGQEDWKYTNVAQAGGAALRPAELADCAALSADVVATLQLATASHVRVVLVNGGYRGDLSQLEQLPPGIRIRSIAAVLATAPDEITSMLAAEAASVNALGALNIALLRDGVIIDIGADVSAELPIHLVLIGTGTDVLRGPRVIVRAGAHSRVRMIEEYIGVADTGGVTNAVTDVTLASGATLHHHRLQTESDRAAHIARVTVTVADHAHYIADSIAFGGGLTRIDIDVALQGRGARCRLNGLFVAAGTQHVDHHTRIEHQVGDTHSEELYRGILDGRSRGVFNGKVIVARDAQQISARQTSNNLLLSRQAEIDTKPELEIYADDVACAHGATVGELDAAAVFYLRSRGIDEATARALLTYAFAQKIADDIPLAGVRRWIENRFLGHADYSQLLTTLVTP